MDNLAVRMQGITKIFNKKKANDSVDFFLKKGSIHGLLGENGAGKTTLMNVLYGLYRQEEGEIYINGVKAEITSPVQAMSLGIGMVHQHFMLARPLSVVENLMLGKKSTRGFLLDTQKVAADIRELSEKYKMNVDPYAKVWQLSVGEQQRVEILAAIYYGAQILILDEPTAVLTPVETEVLFDMLREMKQDGKSIILITHKLEEILSIVDEVTVLRDGKLIGSRLVDEHSTKQELTQMMVGRDVLFQFPDVTKKPGKVKLSLKELCCLNDKGLPALNHFSLDIREGEVVGLAGVDGNGQKELCEAITGMRSLTSGSITLGGKEMGGRKPIDYIREGVSHIPEDRHSTGLAMGWDVKKNLILKTFYKKPFASHGIMSAKAVQSYAEQIIEDYQIKVQSAEDGVRGLSGGNQQKIILAREIDGEPNVLIANQPTRGLDIGASEYVRQRILEARNKGTSVLLLSADLEEILQLSDRIAVIYDGQIMGVLSRGASVGEIGALMMGKKQEGIINEK